MSDDSNSDLEEQRIDRQRRALLREGGDTYQRSNENVKSTRRIVEFLIGAALLGLGAEVWLLKGTVEVQQASIQFLQKQMDTVAAETRDNSHKVDEMQGRFYRGMQEGKNPYAPDKQ